MIEPYAACGRRVAAAAERLEDAIVRGSHLEADLERHRLVTTIHALLDVLEADAEPTRYRPLRLLS